MINDIPPNVLRKIIWVLKFELDDVDANPAYIRSDGICRLVSDALSSSSNIEWRMKNVVLLHAYETWPEYSGFKCYPIKCPSPLGPNTERAAEAAFKYFSGKGMMWSPKCEYGRSRIRLAKHIIAECNNLLQKYVDDSKA